jgi:hypothetical protein
MSGLETLPPDQRAVLKLILEQGRGYAELASLLKIDADAVRTRAHAGLDALGVDGAGELTPAHRAQVADYLLGQQDEGERIVALAELGDSPAAIRWGHALRDRLTPLARAPLPELPALAAGNGAATPAPAPAEAAPATAAPAPPPPPEPPAVLAPPSTSPPPASPPPTAPAASPPRPGSSRLGGAIVLAVVAAAIVVAVLLLTGGDDKKAAATSASTPTATAPTPTTTTGSQASNNLVGAVRFKATSAGGKAFAVGLVQVQQDNTLKIALEAQKLPGNGAHDVYGVWLEGSATGAKFLGYIPRQVKQNGTFAVNAPIPSSIRTDDTILVTRESTANPDAAAPTQPGPAILSGPLKLRS